MHGSRASIGALLSQLKEHLVDEVQMAVFPPFPFLQETAELLSGTPIAWGAQNVAAEEYGAFTGEVSAAMLVEFGCRFVIVGHSERRSLYGEDDALITKKCKKALEKGLTPILCVGETLEEKESGLTRQIVGCQLLYVLDRLGVEAFTQVVLAYEPVWAIGTGRVASADEAEDVHAFLYQMLAERSMRVAEKTQLLYGGSLKAANAKALFSMPHINGGLVGGASLDGKEFLEMAKILADQRLLPLT